MNGCRRFRLELQEYVDGRSDKVRNHLYECEDCRRAAQQMLKVKAMVAALPSEPAPADFSAAVRRRLETDVPPKKLDSRARILLLAGAAATLVVVAVGLRTWLVGTTDSELAITAETLSEMTKLHSQVQVAYVLPPDSPLVGRLEAPEFQLEYDELYDLEGM